MNREYLVLMGDFETTVYDGQQYTEVWASASVELYTEDVKIFTSIDDQFRYLKSLKRNIIIYYHNLKFDGQFWVDYLMRVLNYELALDKLSNKEWDVKWKKNNRMYNNSFKVNISEMGQWYRIIIKTGNYFIEIRDSLKLLPFSVERIGESFDTKHKKLHIDYKGRRKAGGVINQKEREYISNDVLVVKEALEIMFQEGHSKLTIGSCCLSEYKDICNHSLKQNVFNYKDMFPNLYEMNLPEEHFYKTAGNWILKSYKGGWCYLCKGKENRVIKNGITIDVNSLYPSMMHSESGNIYPIGYPMFWTGNYIPDICQDSDIYYFVRFRCRFKIKKGYLPFVQIKGNILYRGNECLETSDIYDPITDQYYTEYTDLDNTVKQSIVELTMTMTDYKLFLEHYNVFDFEILDGCYFHAECGIFDEYIDKYKEIKLNNKGAKRELAKLFLNNLYGKMASSTNSSFKVPYFYDDKTIHYVNITEYEKQPGYIAVGSAITSYARNFTIRAAQANYYGNQSRGFIYADTDSIHCDLSEDELKGIKLHDKNFCCWKIESEWDKGIFVRQKTYIEHIRNTGEYNVKCAGMPDRCKSLFVMSLNGTPKPIEECSEEERKFLYSNSKPIKRTLKDFCTGLIVPGKLLPKRIIGGIVLKDTCYEMRPS